MSNNQDQIARRRATQDVIAANRALFEERMRHYYEEMDLGEWTPRLTPKERAERKAEAERLKATQKIHALAEAAGLAVAIDHFPVETVEEKVKRIAEDAEEFEALSEEEQEARIAQIRAERATEDDGADEFDRRAEFTDNVAVVKSVVAQG